MGEKTSSDYYFPIGIKELVSFFLQRVGCAVRGHKRQFQSRNG
jgi:hypothetical protein